MRPLNRFQQEKLDSAFRRSWREDARQAQKGFCYYCEELLTAKRRRLLRLMEKRLGIAA